MTQVASVAHRVEVIASSGSALQAAVASLNSSGQRWGSFTMGSGWSNGDVFRAIAGGSIMQYTDRMSWNPINNTVLFLGGVHFQAGSPFNANEGNRFVRWRDADNTWTNAMPAVQPNFDPARWFTGDPGIGIGHSYQHDCIDTTTGDYYHRSYGQTAIARFRHSTQSWSMSTPIAAQGALQVAGAMDYLPERHSLIFVDGDWGVWEYSITAGTWTIRASTSGGGPPPNCPGIGNYHGMARYVPADQAVYFGSGQGTTNIYRYKADGSVAQRASSPFDIGVLRDGGTTGAVTCTDSRTGDMLCWRATDAACYRYTPSSNQWTPVPAFNHPNGSLFLASAVTIPLYHCVLFAMANDQPSSLNRLDVLRL